MGLLIIRYYFKFKLFEVTCAKVIPTYLNGAIEKKYDRNKFIYTFLF